MDTAKDTTELPAQDGIKTYEWRGFAQSYERWANYCGITRKEFADLVRNSLADEQILAAAYRKGIVE